ncbi:PAP2 superfamily protein [Hirsutella rhossiliensis]|uniref:PAP2 superfamily domain-containing protein n=1 Tax=Hirsutella rhossiliensis TaxID=111463 RepID=A0A9P8MPP2_9HYPO|nr:PAP2 superfamily domain-containing protein [Hirsutella rhossiliensis]KAH0958229.1 PAP2 superfamily domain-containing protein [Hirsutella rhossiliensis]
MGLLSRGSRAPKNGAVDPAVSGGERAHPTRDQPASMTTRPSFGQWLKHTWLDLLTMAAMGAVGLGVYNAHPAPSRSFAVTFSDGEVVYPEFAYPLRKEIIPIWLAAFLASVVPIAIILAMQVRVRSFWDVNNAVIGLLYSLIAAAVFQVFIKWLIGGLRPHFLDVCKPDLERVAAAATASASGYNYKGYRQIYFTSEVCTGDRNQINDSLESMPSGHTTAAFAGFVYLYLYLNAKLKVFSNYHPAMWKLIALYAPLLGAVLIGGALTIDEFHNWYDIVAGAVIGAVMAFSSYRMTYAAVWDFRFNHVPLSRGAPFAYHLGGGAQQPLDAVFTRKAGWGSGGGGGLLGRRGEKATTGGPGGGHFDGHDHGHGHGQHAAGPTIPRRAVGGGQHADDMV